MRTLRRLGTAAVAAVGVWLVIGEGRRASETVRTVGLLVAEDMRERVRLGRIMRGADDARP